MKISRPEDFSKRVPDVINPEIEDLGRSHFEAMLSEILRRLEDLERRVDRLEKAMGIK